MASTKQNAAASQADTITHPSHVVTRATPNIVKKAKRLSKLRGFRKFLAHLARFKKVFSDEIERRKIAALEAARGPFRFRDLPGELRNRIYRLLLVSTKPFVVEFSGSSFQGKNPYRIRTWRHRTGRNNFSINILCASHQMLHEALPMLYGTQMFYMHTFFDARRFLQILGPERRQLLTTIYLMWSEGCESHAQLRRTVQFLRECASLKYFTIKYYPDTLMDYPYKLTDTDVKGCLAKLENFRLLTVKIGCCGEPAWMIPSGEIQAYFGQMVAPKVEVKLVHENLAKGIVAVPSWYSP